MKPLLLVDGYNVIGAWERVRREGMTHEEAREALLHLLADYAGYSGQEIVAVFDGYKSGRRTRSQDQISGVSVVFTMQGETADNYIEAVCDKTPPYREVRVATSDSVEQTVTMGRGAVRISSRELLIELSHVRKQGHASHAQNGPRRNTVDTQLPEDVRNALEKMRRQ
jgi:predicted RNA-binding protein with PIN domain